MYNIEISSHTDIGDVKQTNQDCIFTKNDVINGHNVGLFVVADGCGGLAYGEEISNLIVTYFARVCKNELFSLLQNKEIKPGDINELLEKAIKDINESALVFGHNVGSKVGSTLSLLLTIDNRYYIKNVGDSRIYLVRKKRIRQLTEDQSLVADLIRNGELTTEEAKTYKKKNVLTMCIGVFDDIKTYSKQGKIKNNDTFVLCCDGLHNHVTAQKMLQIVVDKKIDFKDKSAELRNCIDAGKANDNVSCVICSYKKKQSKVKIISLTILVVLLFAIVVGVVVGNYIQTLVDEAVRTMGTGLCEECGKPQHEGACLVDIGM